MGPVMSDQPAVLRAVYERWNARDLDGLIALHDPDLLIVPRPQADRPGVSYRGLEALRMLVEESFALGPSRLIPKDFRTVGSWQVVDLTTVLESPEPVQSWETVWLYLVAGGKVKRAEGFNTITEAFEAAQWPAPLEFRALFHNAHEPIMVVDDAGRIVELNPAAAAVAGVPDPGSLRSRLVSDLIAPDATSTWLRDWRELRSAGRVTGSTVLRTAEGKERSVDFRAIAHYVPGRHLVMLLGASALAKVPSTRDLTPREREIFGLLACGFNAPEIAAHLYLSPATVRTHVQNGMQRIGARTRVHAIAIALASGQLSPAQPEPSQS
jgi:PAS domain S-box-containing protein